MNEFFYQEENEPELFVHLFITNGAKHDQRGETSVEICPRILGFWQTLQSS